jgi:cellulose synthase (UDP-forming)
MLRPSSSTHTSDGIDNTPNGGPVSVQSEQTRAMPKASHKTSLLRVVLFALALSANGSYLLFIVNPAHADNLAFFAVTALADTIAIVIFSSTWIVALYFELFKGRYYREIAELRRDGLHLLENRVAVFVPVVNEDLDLVRNTIRSLWALRGDKRIYLLDDGRRPSTRDLADEMRIGYLTREGNEFFKAGNLNNALRLISEEFVVVVDADFALHPGFIEATLPLFHDPAIAAVQTPQVYSNEETLFAKGSRYLQAVFYRYLQPGRNLLDSSFCVGTNVIYRTSSLREVGGIAEVHHSEDVFTTLKLLEVGLKVFYLDEPLAVGLGPASLIAFYNQQFRWARGGLTMMLRHSTLLNRRLRPDQRVQFFLSNFFYLSGVAVAIYLVSPLVAILLNVKPINDAYFWEWLPKYLLFFATNFLFFLSFAPRNRLHSLVLGMFSYMPYLAALCSVLFGLPHFNWKPTNAKAKGLITTLLAPYVVYVVVALATGVMLALGVIAFRASFAEYYFWLGVDTLIAGTFIVHSYLAQPLAVLPVFDEALPIPEAAVESIQRLQREPMTTAYETAPIAS